MTVPVAHRIRRVVLLAFAVAATLGAHAIGTGGIHLSGRTALVVAALVAFASAAPVSRGVFLPRGPLSGATILLVAQLASHALLSVAPDAVGVTATHAAHSSWSVVAVGVHVVLAVQLGLVMAFADRLLAGLVRVIHAARAFVARLTHRPGAAPPAGDSPGRSAGCILRRSSTSSRTWSACLPVAGACRVDIIRALSGRCRVTVTSGRCASPVQFY